jgi:hypothetical protein
MNNVVHDADDLVSDMDDDQSVAGDHRDIEEVIAPGQGGLINHAVKMASDEEEKTGPSPNLLESSRGGSMPTTRDAEDTTSVRSLPTVHVSEPQSPPPRPATARSQESSTSNLPPGTPSSLPRSQRSAAENSLNPADRRARHRSTLVEV